MDMYETASTQQPAAICILKSPIDAIHILEAARLGLVPRVTRRLTGHERSMIRPGTVWVWEEAETNMRRWTDGRRWGASRVGGGGFLVYTESSESLSPPRQLETPYGHNMYHPGSTHRSDSLIKQTYSTTMTHPVTGKVKKFHVVAYSSKRNPQGDPLNPLPLPHQLPALRHLKVTPGIWPEWETPTSSPATLSYPLHPQQPPTAYPPSYPQSRPEAYPRASASTPAYFHNPSYMSPGISPAAERGMYQPAEPSHQPPSHLNPMSNGCSQHTNGSSNKRYHPYEQPSRNIEQRPPSFFPGPPPMLPAISNDFGREMGAYGPPAWIGASRGSPAPQYAYSYPTRPSDYLKNGHYYDTPLPYPPYRDPMPSDGRYAVATPGDTRRYTPVDDHMRNQLPHLYRDAPSTYNNANQGNEASRPATPGELNAQYPGDRTSGSPNLPTGGVTLPPLRATFKEEASPEGGGSMLPPASKLSPSGRYSVVDRHSSQSPSGVPKTKVQNTWAEDARQLGELGRRVVL
ncbi:conserved hypothetical protein [Cryptococcus deneoformans JEC21]|uniref:cAMP-independent regulatory protein pac2 n=1 Tax=Cryptococcus deneoformans (strain JEC21 / ATCC MYA-565) TaxID=214684 RepID=Q5KFK4_CRYD1|nr:conserved hypothetical protein [Cryptococcus neoformans var. neoformans JEC21]AAW43980.1 conserved hypothetical protein [Cryptococcus neoformans var. neoformans JEC21]